MIAGLICAGLALFFVGVCVGFMLAELSERTANPPSKNMMEPPEFLKRK